uniref:HGWP repeat containing protein-like n=1 Tax=Oryza nivara TaxID=4536 RepID=A0A679BAA0_ORYNI|nr:HGWP repeat containing protein-like [Oryza sativa f. spontanea]
MEPRSPRPFPPSPAALSPSRRYIFAPRASLLRFRRSPLALAVGFVLATSTSLSAVAADLRYAADVAPGSLPTRRHLHRLRRVVADPVRPYASPADRRSSVALVIPNRAAAFLHSGRRFRRPRCPGVGPGRQPPAPAGAADAWDPRRRPPPAACSRSTVDREADAWAPLPWTRKRSFGEDVLGGVLAYTPVERL